MEGKKMEMNRKKNFIIWGLDAQLNLEAGVKAVISISTSKVEVDQWRRLETREGKVLVIAQLKEEGMVTEILNQRFRFRGKGVSV